MALISSIGDCKTTLSTISYFVADMDNTAMRKYCDEMYTTLTENFGAIDDKNTLHEYISVAPHHELHGIVRYLYSTLSSVYSDRHQGKSWEVIQLSWR